MIEEKVVLTNGGIIPVGLTSSCSPPPSLRVMVLVPGLAVLTLVSDKNIVVHPLFEVFATVYQKCTFNNI